MNRIIQKFLVVAVLAVVMLSCDKKDTTSNCEELTTVSNSEYNDAPKDDVQIIEAQIADDCLRLKYAASGCDGASWKIKFIAIESITLPAEPTMMARLSLDNKELCEAYITKETTFDISNLQKADANKVNIILQGYDTVLEYNY